MRYVLGLMLFASICHAQPVRIDFDPMPVHRQGIGLWLAARERAVVTIGNVSGECWIEETPVRGLFRRTIDPCVLVGVLSDGSHFKMDLPAEPVVVRRFRVVALAIDCPFTLTRKDGSTRTGVVHIPDCVARRTWIGGKLADAVTGVSK